MKERDLESDLFDLFEKQKKIDVDSNWKKLHKRIHRDTFFSKLFYTFNKIAAFLLLPLLFCSGYLLYELLDYKKQPIKNLEVKASYGVITKVTLPDSSKVILNSGSKLIYPERFIGKHRKVFLDGEAYFKVTADLDNRFDVYTSNGLKVSAYGTEFNVEAYNDDYSIKSTLTKGKLFIEHPELNIRKNISPGQQAIYVKDSMNINLRTVDIISEISWKDGKLIFNRTPIKDVIRKLSRKFNVKIQLIGDNIDDYSYSATFKNETLEDILFLLSKTAPLKYKVIECDNEKYQKSIIIYSLN